MNLKHIYKIITNEELQEAKLSGTYLGSFKDIQDGFMHFSAEEQIENTLKVEGNVIFKNPDGSLITGDQITYNKTKNYLSANGNIIIDDNKSYKIYTDRIKYFKDESKIITEGKTTGIINNDYKIETKNLVFLRDEMLFFSDKEIKFYSETKDNFLSLKNFSYSIKIADFYYNDSAKSMIDRIKNETDLKNPLIKKLSKTKYRVLLGPFNDIKKLEDSFNEIKKLDFENLEIIKDV